MHNPYDELDMPANCEEVWQMGYGLQGDINQDCSVDLVDLNQLGQEWLSSGGLADIFPAIGDDVVNMGDFGILGFDWLKENDPQN